MNRVSVIDQRVEIRPEAGAVRSRFSNDAGGFPMGQTLAARPVDPQANKLKELDFKSTARDHTNGDGAIPGTEPKQVIYPVMCEADGSNETQNRNPGAKTSLEKTNSNLWAALYCLNHP